jgi:hypothetical protein
VPKRTGHAVQVMKHRLEALLAAVALVVALHAPAAGAADPGRWRASGVSRIPLEYFQGMASDPRRALWFDGIFAGLYRADANLTERRRNDAVIPPDVAAREGYNHVGDISWDAREGGRVLLPLECFYPGRPGGANSCGTGSIGVVDARTLRWRYYVKLDPAEIPKAMWAEVSPDGRLVWTSAGTDLLAYRTSDVTPTRAAPDAAAIRAVRRLPGAAPASGITGAAFYGDRLLVAGQADTLFRVWSVDLATGSRRLEIERTMVGESEGLDVVAALGGTLHWIVTPFDPAGRPPTYPLPGNVLLHFVPRTQRHRLRLAAEPRRLIAGRRTRVTFTATAQGIAAAGAVVRFRGQLERTSAAGVARFTVRLRRPGRYLARATRADLRPAVAAVQAVTQAACARALC